MAWRHVTCPGPGNTCCIYSWLAMSLRSVAILLPLYYSTILTSTFATISTDVPSYEAIHGRMPLHNIPLTISDMFRILDIMNYPFATRHDTQSTCKMSYRFESTDCTSDVSWYVNWIEVDGNRDDLVWISEANWLETHCDTYDEIVQKSPRQIAEVTRLGKYTQLRLTLAETILRWFQRPTGLRMCHRLSQSESIATNSSYQNLKAINRDVNEIW